MSKSVMEITWEELERMDKEKAVMFITFAPIEQHGKHLPLGVDVFESKHWEQETIKLLEAGFNDYEFLFMLPLPFVEVFACIEKAESANKIYKKRFKGGTFLKTTHSGLSAKGNAYAKIYDFAKQNNYKLIEPVIEKYEMKSGKFIIDIMFKVEQ